MSALLDRLLPRPEPTTEADPVRPVVLTDEQCAAMDDMSDVADEMRNTLTRTAFVASVRRFDSRFGELA